MRIWLALLIAPLIALGDQSIGYALTTPACAGQNGALLHAVPLLSLVLTALFTLMAWREAQRLAAGGEVDPGPRGGMGSDDARQRRLLLAQVAIGTGAISVAAVLAMWIPLWALSPCAA